jgi:uncharacterized membrane protein
MRDPAALLLMTLILAAAGIGIWSLTLRFRRRELQHKERMAAIEKGGPLPALTDVEGRPPWTPRVYLLRGMMWLFSGIALTVLLLGVSVTSHRPRSMHERLWDAQRLKDLGATDEQVRQMQNDTSPREGVVLGVSLIGLIPIAVGLAYLIYYRLEGKNMPALAEREPAELP